MKQDKLYTVGGNIRAFGGKKTRGCGCAGNIFDGGGLLEGAFVPQGFSTSQLGTFTYPTLTSSNPLNGFKGIDSSRLPSKSAVKTKSSIDFGSTMSGIASAVSPLLSNAIGGGYSTGRVGEGISTVGNIVGDALGKSLSLLDSVSFLSGSDVYKG